MEAETQSTKSERNHKKQNQNSIFKLNNYGSRSYLRFDIDSTVNAAARSGEAFEY